MCSDNFHYISLKKNPGCDSLNCFYNLYITTQRLKNVMLSQKLFTQSIDKIPEGNTCKMISEFVYICIYAYFYARGPIAPSRILKG
jgi:hypothetical protein